MRVSRNVSSASAMALAAILCLAGVSSAKSSQSNKPDSISIENFGAVNENYYRGAQPERREYPQLLSLGVKTVVDLQREGEDDEQRIVESLGMKFYRIGMSSRSKPNQTQVLEFLKIVNDPVNQPVYIHCKGGRHRTGVMTAVYRLTHDRWTPEQAYVEMKRYEFENGFGHGALKSFVFETSANRDLMTVATTVSGAAAAPSGKR